MKGIKTVFNCTECEYQSPKWLGKCPRCGKWNTFVEDVVEASPTVSEKAQRISLSVSGEKENRPAKFSELEISADIRRNTGMSELDRVLGGGLVTGSAVLLSGEPGIGKSTLLLQICDTLAKEETTLYISGEESASQLKLRAERLGVSGEKLYILTETRMEKILEAIKKINPRYIVADSVQTMYSDAVSSVPGSVTQVRETAMSFINIAKNLGICAILVGHVNKEGGIAGPKVLEHMVDAVLCFEGDKRQSYRIIRANKNRYGSTNEIGVFDMTDRGIKQVPNPSEMLLADRPQDASGNCAVCTVEGTRPLLAEVQALVSPTVFPSPRRTVNGVDYNRICLILAVLEKRLGLRFSANDVYVNVIGGLELGEPACDIGIALALISSITDKVIPEDLIAVGEIGLAGECRAVSGVGQRVKEAARLGFTKAIIPHLSLARAKEEIKDGDIALVPVKNIYDLLKFIKN